MRRIEYQFLYRWLFTVIFCWLSFFCSGQSLDLKFKHLTSENGLPQNGTFGITKDKYGFMWFGTWSGLCRYDGYRFKIYRNQSGKPRSIVNSRIMNIVKDAAQNLWIQTYNDSIICKYNYQTDDFDRIPAKNIPKTFLKKLNWIEHGSQVSFSYNNYSWNIDRKTDRLTQTFLPTGAVRQYVSSPGNRWSLNDSFVTDIYLDDQHVFWVGTYSDGINKANLDAKPFHNFYHNADDPNSIIDNHVRAISGDRVGNIWIGTRANGITIISPNKPYRHLKYIKDNPASISNDHIKKIYCDSRGYIWIGTLRGLDGVDPVTGHLRHYRGWGLENAAIFGIMEDHAHNLWFATWSGIYEYFTKRDSLVRFNTGTDLKSSKAMTIMEDRFQRIWVGTEGGGISIFKNPKLGKLHLIKLFTHGENLKKSLSDDRIYSIYEDSQSFVWIGTGNGLDRYDPAAHEFKHIGASPEELTSATIAAITEDHNGFIWVSHKKGISQVDKRTFAVRNYSTQDGLQSNEFSDGAVYKDGRTGMLYFGGNNGYNVFHPDSIKTDYSLPRIVLTELQILNKPVDVNDTVNGRILLRKPLYLTQDIKLNYADKSIALEFAGLHYANPSGNKYAYMLEGFDKDWIYTDASNRIATYSNLSRGTYIFKVKASNSDGIWNPVAARLKIVVLPPWWASVSAFVVYAIILCMVLYAIFYYSLRYDRLKNKLSYESLLHEKELELRQSKIEFFTNISHEIKTPLSLILAPIERLMADYKDNGLINRQLRTIKENGDRLLRLINQLLDIRRFETGNDTLSVEQDDLGNFIERVVDTFRELAFERNIFLSFETPDVSLEMSFDHDKLEKVLYNLLSNAFKFTDKGGHITVALRKITKTCQEWMIIEVTDDGALIPKGEFEKIFNPFQQATDNKAGGTGLGLAYAKALVELHDGSIMVDSGTDNDGKNNTCFTVALPANPASRATKTVSDAPFRYSGQDIVSDDHEDAVDENAENIVKPNGKNPVLLLVEDNFDLRNYLINYFQSDYKVIGATNGKEGLLLANERLPDIILSDMMMPEMDGLEMCSRLKTEIMTSHIPVILLTAKSTVESQIAGMETGADDYITKPFNLKLLSLKIKNLLETRANLREKYKSRLIIQPGGTTPVSPDEKLLKKVLDFVEENIADPALSIEDICDKIGLSKSQLYRKMKALTGLSTIDLIRQIRLKRAQQFLTDKKFNVNEVSYLVGFTDTDYFRRCFKAQFGVSPSEFVKNPVKAHEFDEYS